jgi:hypothetical protein
VGRGERRKPDLVVKSGDFYRLIDVQEVTWVRRGVEYELTWEAKIKNIGTKAAAASNASIFVKRDGGWWHLHGGRLPRIPAGQARNIKLSFEKTFGPSAWAFGKYPLRICADTFHEIAESNEGNNCRKLTATPLYTIPGTFDGTVSGDSSPPEAWGGSIHLDLTEYGVGPTEGQFFYTVDQQSELLYVDQGSYFDCTVSGKGHISPLHNENLGDTLEMDFRTGKYDLYDRLPFASTFPYPVNVTCPDIEPGVFPGPLVTDEWVRSDVTTFTNPGFTALAGQWIVIDISYSWNLVPDVQT